MSLNREQPMRPFLDELADAFEAYEVPAGSIGTNELADGAVTGPKIADGAVDMDKLADDVLIPQPTDAQVTSAVNAALAAHPEWTTTVQPNSIGDDKLVRTGGVLEHMDNISNIEQRDMLEDVTFVQGSIDTATGDDIPSTTRIRSEFISLEGVESFTVSVDDGYKFVVDWFDSDMTIIKYVYMSTQWLTNETTFYAKEFEGLSGVKLLLSTANNDTILPEASSHLHATYQTKNNVASTHSYSCAKPDLSLYQWTLGNIVDGANVSSNTRVRSDKIPMGVGSKVAILGADKMFILFYYDALTGAYLGNSGGWSGHNRTVPYDCAVRILISRTNGSVIDISEIATFVDGVSAYVLPVHSCDEAKRVANYVLCTSNSVYFEPLPAGSGMWVKFGSMWIRGNISRTNQWADVVAANHATSPSGVADCILIPHNQSIVYDITNEAYAIVANENIKTYLQIPILSVGTLGTMESVIGGIGYHMFTDWLTAEQSFQVSTSKTLEYASLVNNSVDTEQFVYFTDPHLMGHSSDTSGFISTFNKYVDAIKGYADSTPTTFVMCGGDWLNDADTVDVAKWKLGLVNGAGSRIGHFYGMVGNHDTNYQGVDSSGTANTGALDNQTIANAMFGNKHTNYYHFDGTHTRFYVFDSGIDWDNTMTAYRWQQVSWFANALLNDDRAHSAIAIHIWYTNWQDQTDDTISALATNIASVIAAYNARTSITLNGNTYNFTSCAGHVEFVICGHTHFDKSGISGNIPVINTLNTQKGGTPSFDLVYVDYDMHKISTIRIGTGDNRTFNLATF